MLISKLRDYYCLFEKNLIVGTEELVQQLRACTTLPEGLSVVPSITWWLTTFNNCISRGSMTLF